MSAITRAVIVVAAGRGSRSGSDIPKQFVEVCGQPVLQHTLNALSRSGLFETLVLVHPSEGDECLSIDSSGFAKAIKVPGGDSRTASVKAGLAALQSQPPDHVYIHDAARAGISTRVLNRLDEALKTSKAVIPTLPVADALKRVENSHVVEDVDRSTLHRVQTPQAFQNRVVRDAYAAATHSAHDCATLVMQSGVPVARVDGDEMNFKVTYPADFARLENVLRKTL